ncbi:DoxX family protein [Saccharopolyspora erythraea]|uniref:DoxX family protein n=1 Tax=Saccharopolyspora erythraea TaxID=1836 RepID=UPI002011F80A|nr:DoxX family protein [Saccharopolyspora erythraea]
MAAEHVDTTPARPGRALNVTLWVLQALLAAFFVFASLPKLLGDPATVASYDLIGFGQWFRYLTGALELAGAIGLLIPRLSPLAALGLAIVMLCATVANLTVLAMPSAAVTTVVLMLLFAFVAWSRKYQLTGLRR